MFGPREITSLSPHDPVFHGFLDYIPSANGAHATAPGDIMLVGALYDVPDAPKAGLAFRDILWTQHTLDLCRQWGIPLIRDFQLTPVNSVFENQDVLSASFSRTADILVTGMIIDPSTAKGQQNIVDTAAECGRDNVGNIFGVVSPLHTAAAWDEAVTRIAPKLIVAFSHGKGEISADAFKSDAYTALPTDEVKAPANPFFPQNTAWFKREALIRRDYAHALLRANPAHPVRQILQPTRREKLAQFFNRALLAMGEQMVAVPR